MLEKEAYSVSSTGAVFTYSFESIGPKGRVRKIVRFKPMEGNPQLYGLGFGDELAEGIVSDDVVTDNKDGQKVLNTVALILYQFTQSRPYSWIFAEGNTPVKTRLYRIAISNNLESIAENFTVYGMKDKNWQEFQKNIEYNAFLVRRK